MAKNLFYLLLIGTFVFMGACSSNTKEMPGDVISSDYEDSGDISLEDGSQTTGLDGEGNLSMDNLADGSTSDGNIIYFDYNSSEIRDESMPLIMAAANALSSDPAQQIRLEGHADERGTREFNLALGERRAQTVRNLIMLQGVSGNQIDVISYGEEKPAVIGSDEASWQENRRVVLVY